MTGLLTLQFDAFYHIYSRGINRENIFFEPRNYDYFMNMYSRHIIPVADTFAYCLLNNHIHFLVRIKSEEEIKKTQGVSKTPWVFPSRCFSNFFNTYAKAINKAYNRVGSLFQHPFGRRMISRDSYLYRVVTYIHQNPQKHEFIEDFRQWNYSSYKSFLNGISTFLKREEVLNWFGGKDNFILSHKEWIETPEVAQLSLKNDLSYP